MSLSGVSTMTVPVDSIRIARLALATRGAEIPFTVPLPRLSDQIVEGLRIAFEARCALSITFETGARA